MEYNNKRELVSIYITQIKYLFIFWGYFYKIILHQKSFDKLATSSIIFKLLINMASLMDERRNAKDRKLLTLHSSHTNKKIYLLTGKRLCGVKWVKVKVLDN